MWPWGVLGLAVAFVVAALLYYFNFKSHNVQTLSLDEIVGEKCSVLETVDNYAGCGLVKVRGQQWSARGVNDDDIFEIGETLIIVAIEGVKLICRKK